MIVAIGNTRAIIKNSLGKDRSLAVDTSKGCVLEDKTFSRKSIQFDILSGDLAVASLKKYNEVIGREPYTQFPFLRGAFSVVHDSLMRGKVLAGSSAAAITVLS